MSSTQVLRPLSISQPAGARAELVKYMTLSRRQNVCDRPVHHQSRRADLQSSRLFSFSSPSLSRRSSVLRSCFRKNRSSMIRKRVVFADDKGLDLTAVHLFTTEPFSSSSSSPDLLKEPFLAPLPQRQLDFPQPTQNIEAFIARLQRRKIQMESCNISNNTLSGKVCVIHSTNKAAHMRVTFDSWKSHQDMLCTFVEHKHFLGLDIAVFSFKVNLPQNLYPNKKTEFYFFIHPEPGCAAYCDDNRGQNYKVCMLKDGLHSNHGNRNHFHRELSNSWQPNCWSDLHHHHQRYLSSRNLQIERICV
uniref:CBM21 domain-containing protein n=1 Tax=Nothobranchius kuhntae TaxID=321403 RepID=A0A1A8KNR5_NOTKU